MAVMVVLDLYLIYAFYDLLQFPKFLKPFFEFIDIVQSKRMNRPHIHLPISFKLPQPEFPFFFISWRVGEFYNSHDS